jgi:hypothetical protein
MRFEDQKLIVESIELAIKQVKLAASTEQKIKHSKHFCSHYRIILDELNLKWTGENTLLTRIKLIGR